MPIQPPTSPLTDGVVTLRLRRPEDVDAVAEASHDPDTRRWLDDEPMDDTARAGSWAFNDLGLTEILLEADEANKASIRVAEKCRFTQTTTSTAPDGRTKRVFARSSS